MKKLLFLLSLMIFTQQLSAQTQVVIRAKSKDAKFIGSSIGGAKVIVRKKSTGEILVQGFTEGSTGNTDIIMRQPHERYQPIATEGTAKFVANLEIGKPEFVEVEVIAPYNQKQAAISATTELWVIPGKDITGDGVVVEIPGFIVDVLAPQTHETIEKEQSVEIAANVVMMCGCPLTSGGMWDADSIEVVAIVTIDGKLHDHIPLSISEKANTFKGSIPTPSPGLYEVTVYSFDPRTGNTGVDKVNFSVR